MNTQEKMTTYYQKVVQSVEFLKEWNKGEAVPEFAVVLGSGLSNVIPNYANMKCISYSEIPGFKTTNVPGHTGELRVGKVSVTNPNGEKKERQIAFLHGRNHAYEGNNPAEVVHNLRTLIQWGVKGVVLTNASGCLNKSWTLGKMMLITDHINATAMSPLFGEYGRGFGPQFVDLSDCYNLSWQAQFKNTAARMNEELYSGVYYGVQGPQYETPAEIKMMQNLGASAVGMSTVLESIAVKQMGIKLAGISCLTNYGAGLHPSALNHEDVTAMGKKSASNIGDVLINTIVNLEV